MRDNPGGLIVHRGSRTERLADALALQLEAQRPANPLAAQTVVVAHPGLQRWLLGHLAQRSGPHGGHGIAANIEMILPWQWFERAARRVLGDEALIGGAYRHELLRWRLLAALPSLKAPEVAAYLAGDDAARRGFQLAEHLAGLYTQYLIYRPDWILDWEQHPAQHGGDWQAALWQRLRAAIPQPHRAQRSAALLQALRAGGGLAGDPPLHVFGVSHLPPDVLAALQATALHTPVHLYFPDPCREHWVYLRKQRFLLAHADDPEALYYEVGHPLLVALGRIAQDFCLSLDECDAIDERDPLDEAEPLGRASSLLDRLQSSIRCLQPELVGAPIREQRAGGASLEDILPALSHDASLRVHACHTRLRELEVLKNALLRFLADDPALQHRDIVVMAPDIGAYAPYLAAVFGEPAQYRSDPLHIPWHLADVGLAQAHPLMNAFSQVLDLAESRFTVSEVLDFLDVPAVARRFAIDAGGRDALERWLRRARVAWGLDAAMKAAAGAAAVDANSWQFGLDRMYAGLIVGQDADGELLDGILPLQGIAGGTVEALGQLDRLLGELRQVRHAFAGARPLAAWSAWLLERLDALFLADPRDAAEQNALDALRRLTAGLAGQAAEADVHTPLPWSVVREALRGALDAMPERQAFLLGGVTFCGLVPQRSIPFRVVCLLGMNEGEFPRPGHDAGLNRILGQPRRGDRDTRNEDRYLFLEALMSARDALHVSYVGEGVHDGKPRNPAAPLAELLQFLDEQHGLAADAKAERPWHVRHPLQPFDARYYERDAQGQPRHDPRLFSYEPTFLAAAPAGAGLPPFLDPPRAAPETVAGGEISLGALKRFWRDPVRDALQRGQGISLQALDDNGWPDREPLETPLEKIERVDHRLLFEALAAGRDELPVEPPAWLARSGMLAGGAIGEQTWIRLRDSLRPLLAQAQPLFAGGSAQPQAQAIDLDLGDGLRLTGVVDRVFHGAGDSLLWFDARPGRAAHLKDLLAFYIDWACLKLARADDGSRLQATLLEQVWRTRGGGSVLVAQRAGMLDAVMAQDDDRLRHGLRRLIEACRAAEQRPLLFFPRTAQAWAASEPEDRRAKAIAAWEGDGFNPGERDYAPGYAALLSRGLDLFDETGPAHRAFIAATELVCGVLDPGHTTLLKEPRP
ncbi:MULTISPECIES: exodeoxyribonuclease V subunit gamma [Rhodanobacter]|uniref:exodeoxyribonuclease V subunit gamma n=1 Tax=unclassified Rhodanobacter TaxID=2621553 RepID=UPI0007A9FD5C|nr:MULTISPECIES: exodeoxyribonuclease V subunit gamma [unclassified Rhodanobacter]KZC16362.1 exodeoxyribonuclease V subunit gamma [Rhodanobacter sp. FW104-R8]KZC25431.1 exodeoxyribonuclease V subunit gamma [Rhodanobacter sp. FW510-T8]KZC31375.1 exodeoxyribonuclease V subunit gamma [Rhodanobacter sp. FW510-R10]